MNDRKIMDGPWHEEKHFLNGKGFHSTAFIMAMSRLNGNWFENDLIISDCDKKIHLAIDIHTAPQRANTVSKLRLIAEVCNRYADWIERNGATLSELIRERKANDRLRGIRPQRKYFDDD